MVLIAAEPPPEESIRLIHQDAWLVGNSFILRRYEKFPGCSLYDGSAYWIIEESLPSPLPRTQPVTEIKGVFERQTYSRACVMWRLGPYGKLMLKAKMRNITNPAEKANMQMVRKMNQKKKLSFEFPRLFYGAIEGHFPYTVESTVRGVPLYEVWDTFSEERKDRVAEQVATAVDELSRETSDAITAAEVIPTASSLWLTLREHHDLEDGYVSLDKAKDYLEANIREVLSWDFVEGPKHFTHTDLGPYNVLVDPADPEHLGIVDWERAGYYPRQAIATDLLTGNGMDLIRIVDGGPRRDPDDKDRLAAALAKRRFRGYPDKHAKWFSEIVFTRGYRERVWEEINGKMVRVE